MSGDPACDLELTLEERTDLLEDGQAADAEVLSEGVLHEEHRHADDADHDDVGDEEGA